MAGLSSLVVVLVGLLVAMAANSERTAAPPTLPAAQALGAPSPATGDLVVAAPGGLRGGLRTPSLLVVAEDGAAPVRLVSRQPGVASVEPVGLGSLVMMGRSVTALSVDPSTYRRLAPRQTAAMDAVWAAVARGELAATHDMAQGLQLQLGAEAAVGPPEGATAVRVGAIATTVPAADLVVNRPRGAQLGIPTSNGLVVTLGEDADASDVRTALAGRLGERFAVTDLTPSSGGVYAAQLVGGSVATAAGSFRYEWFADGTVAPDPAWVSANIRTETVPILGRVTCHRVMLPQLRGALQEIVDAGLAGSVDAGDTAGATCRGSSGATPPGACPCTRGASRSTSTSPATRWGPSARSTGGWWPSSAAGASAGVVPGECRTRCTSSWRCCAAEPR